MSTETFRCGHPKTPDNTKISGADARCFVCRIEAVRRQTQRRKESDRASGKTGLPTDGSGWDDMCRHGSRALLEAYATYYAKYHELPASRGHKFTTNSAERIG